MSIGTVLYFWVHKKGVMKMKYKWVIMQELEDTNCANPCLIVDSEERAEKVCLELEEENIGFIYWTYPCMEE